MFNFRLSFVRPVAGLMLIPLAALLAGCQRTRALEGPHIRPIDGHCLPAGVSPPEIPLYQGEIATNHAKIATIDSFAADCKDEATVREQLLDLQRKARLAGADALTHVRPLSHKLYGFLNDPNTPFPSVRQGSSEMYFFRATAIKYQEPVVGDPPRIEVKEPPLPAGAVPVRPTGISGFSPFPLASQGPTP